MPHTITRQESTPVLAASSSGKKKSYKCPKCSGFEFTWNGPFKVCTDCKKVWI